MFLKCLAVTAIVAISATPLLISTPAEAASGSAISPLETTGSSLANATEDESATPAVLPSDTPDFSSMTPDEIYAAKTRVTHEQLMEQVGAVESATATPLAAASGCVFAADGDHVHVSTYDGIRYASGHGYWLNVDCPSSYRATVTIWLEEKLGTGWYPQGDAQTKTGRKPGTGSAARVNAKMKCVNKTSHKWRSVVVADIDGHANTAPSAITAAQSLSCY